MCLELKKKGFYYEVERVNFWCRMVVINEEITPLRLSIDHNCCQNFAHRCDLHEIFGWIWVFAKLNDIFDLLGMNYVGIDDQIKIAFSMRGCKIKHLQLLHFFLNGTDFIW